MGTESTQKKKKDSIFDLPANYFDFASVLRLPSDTASSASDPHNVSLELDLGVGVPSTSSQYAPIPNDNEIGNGNGENEEEKQGKGMGMGMTMSRWSCKTCTAEFSSLQDQRSHFKSDFHRFNVKRRIVGRGPLNEEEFEEVAQGTILNDDDISSISGSDEESDEPISCGSQPRTESVNRSMSIKNQILISLWSGEIVSIWRSLLLGDKEDLLPEHDNSMVKENDAKGLCLADKEVIGRLRSLVQKSGDQKNLRVVLLASGGHFAGCVFDGNNILAHKTYHRYVVRAKAGGRQSTKDSTGRAPKSGGASLRRYNEMALKKEILELLAAWKCHLDSALCIYIYAPSINGQVFFGGENPPLIHHDNRVRRISFTTRRPTLKEAKRIYHQLTCVYTAERPEIQFPNELEESPLNSKKEKEDPKEFNKTKIKTKNKTEKASVPETCSDLDHWESSTISETSDISNTVMVNQSGPLHEAARSGNAARTLELLEQESNPCIKDDKGQTPYVLAADKETRNVFRRFMAANPNKWDWHAANVPSPLTEEMEVSQAAKQAEKDAKRKAKAKEMKKLRKSKQKAQAQSTSLEVASVAVCYGQNAVSELLEKGKALPNMQSHAFQEDLKKVQAMEREKRAAAAEKRMLASSKNSGNVATAVSSNVGSRDMSSDIHCSCCAASLVGKVPFHRYNYKYCSASCMHHHREMLEDE